MGMKLIKTIDKKLIKKVMGNGYGGGEHLKKVGFVFCWGRGPLIPIVSTFSPFLQISVFITNHISHRSHPYVSFKVFW